MKTNRHNPQRLWRLLLLLWLAALPARGDSIINTKHNLSVSGPGPIKSATETDVCIFCHTPHNATKDAPLWNRYDSGSVYIPYSSTTAKATIGQPTGASKLCLSCHDGTVALGLVRSRSQQIPMQGGITTLPPGTTRLGTDLSDDHPVSFTYDSALATADGQLNNPDLLTPPVRLDKTGQLQCTACHDPHNNQYGKFLVRNNYASALCVTCHNKTHWQNSSHRTSGSTWNRQGTNPWPHTAETTVAANACENCHAPHGAGTKPRLLNFADEEQNCYSCHTGNVASKNIQPEFNKISIHPILSTSGIHDPTEDVINPTRHVECVDCHNPHATRAATASAPNAPGPLSGVVGVNSSGGIVNPATKEHELCFRCHADSTHRGQARVTRQFVQTNTRIEFSSSSTSFHPVVTTGRNPSVPSLITPWTTASLMYCGDCHNNDQGPGAGGTGPKGPHGSSYIPILERQLALTDYNVESSGTYALCYKCHSRTSILGNESFPYHNKHIVEFRAACTTCHDPHGVESKPHLMNFNTTYVKPSSVGGRLEYNSTGTRHGNCYLSCHDKDGQNKDHGPKSY
jgi:predicted CXXCH cytochrome family protein